MPAQSPYEHSKFNEQVQLEHEMIDQTRGIYWRRVKAAQASHSEGELPYGIQLVQQHLKRVSDALRAGIEEPAHVTRPPLWFTLLRGVDFDVTSYIALKAVINGISSRLPLTATALTVGSRIEDQQRLSEFKAQRPDLFKITAARLDATATSNRNRRKAVLRLMSNRAGITWKKWTQAQCLSVGMYLIGHMESAGIVHRETIAPAGKSRKRQHYIYATDSAAAWIDECANAMSLRTPRFLPMLMPPKKWTTPRNGGYWSGIVPQVPLVKNASEGYLDEMQEQDPVDVYEAINAVQSTAWTINKRVLDVINAVKQRGDAVAGLPSMDNLPEPVKPPDIKTNAAERKRWRRQASQVAQQNFRVVSKRFALLGALEIAERVKDEPEIYFPHQFDFRGRLYAIPVHLNPQGPDYCKALLTFAHGLPISATDQSAGWLSIHGANVFGHDKVSLENRIDWVESNSERIVAAAEDPLGNVNFWSEADQPWQFLAFCFEWNGFLTHGDGFISTLPIALDGSCNGLQHYSAALRDAVGGRATNLTPADKPADIYAEVAAVTKSLISDIASDTGSDPGTPAWFAAKWLDFGIDRKITKRSVMTLPYGCTLFACREFIDEAMRENLNGAPSPFTFMKRREYDDAAGITQVEHVERDGIFEAALFLQPYVWNAISRVVKKARAAMDWLRSTASISAREGLPITWKTPDGFTVQQAYWNTKKTQIKTHLDGKLIRPVLLRQTNKIDVRRMANGVAPNFVHSLDGCALRKYVVLAQHNGLSHFGLVHDSFATVAADVPMMAACIREAFIELYSSNDVFQQFLDDVRPMLSDERQAELRDPPAKGALNLNLVRDADYFFA